MSEPPAVVWPELPYATVRWRAATVKADSPDEDLSPDWAPLVGKNVRLTPRIGDKPFGMVAYDRLGSDPITIWVDKIDAVFNSNGYLTFDGAEHPVRILATDSDKLSVTGWHWTAEFEGFKVSFSAPAGSEINLTPYMSAPLEVESKLWVERLLEVSGGLRTMEARLNRAGPHVVLRFDDGYQNNLTVAAPILARYGMRGTLFTGTHPTNWLGTVKNGSQILTAPELVRLHTEYGWEIASHTRTHVDALSGGLDLSAFTQNVRASIGDLVSYGLPRPRSFAYANGSRSPALDRAMYRMFDKIALTGHPNRVPMPYDKPVAFTGWIAVDESTGPDVRDRLVGMAKVHIQTCFEQGLIPVIGFHGILAAPTNSFDLNTQTFTELIEWIAARGYPVGTLSETRNHNLLSDPGFEEHPVRTWSEGSHPWGKNKSTGWQQVADNSDNASNTIMRLDTGGVAIDGANAVSVEQHIAVTPGASYKFYVNVRQPVYVSGSVRVNVYWRDVLGVERSQNLSVMEVPKTTLSSWTIRPVATFTAPTGAASARIHIQSHSIDGFNGTCEIAWLAVFEASTYDPWTA